MLDTLFRYAICPESGLQEYDPAFFEWQIKSESDLSSRCDVNQAGGESVWSEAPCLSRRRKFNKKLRRDSCRRKTRIGSRGENCIFRLTGIASEICIPTRGSVSIR
jgi:hypothetical protein